MSQKYTAEKLKSELWEYYNTHGELPKVKNIRNGDYASRQTYNKYFETNSWVGVLESAGFDEKDIEKYKFETGNMNITKQSLLNQIKRYKEEFGEVPKSRDMTRTEGYSSAPTFYDYFPNLSWDGIVQEAGLEKPKRKITKQDILDEIDRVINELDETPTSTKFYKHSKYSAPTIVKFFDKSYITALEEAGYNPEDIDYTLYSDEEILNELKNICDSLGRSVTQKELLKHGLSYSVIRRYFGSLCNALLQIGYEPTKHRNVSKQELIDDFHALHDELNRIPRQKDITEYSRYSYRAYANKFGTIDGIVRESDLKMEDRNYNLYSDEEILEELRRVSKLIDRVPTIRDMKEQSFLSKNIFYKRFGNIMNAREKAGLPRKAKTTWIERWAYDMLNELNIPFRKEVPIGSYCVDVMIEKQSLDKTYVLELDGDYYHSETYNNYNGKGDLVKQSERDEFIHNKGYHVIRVWESDIRDYENRVRDELEGIFRGNIEPSDSGEYII